MLHFSLVGNVTAKAFLIRVLLYHLYKLMYVQSACSH